MSSVNSGEVHAPAAPSGSGRTAEPSELPQGAPASIPYEEIGPYRILGVIGIGGMGTVYKGLQPDIQRHVAIKILHPELATRPDAQARLYREACAVNSVGHPGLVQISEVEPLPDGNLYLVMDFLRGETLAARLQRCGGKLSVGAALSISAALADILAAAHQAGVVHRDIKPSNVMLVKDSQVPGGERVKLIDFGIAKILSSGLPGEDKTPQDTVLGTPAYMSPEQCAGDANIDGQSDVYALGALLFHLVAGRPPFVAATPRLVMAKHQLEQPVPLHQLYPQAPAALTALISQLLAKAPMQRPRMESVLASLRALGQSLPDRETPESTGTDPSPAPDHRDIPETVDDVTSVPAPRRHLRARVLLLPAALLALGSSVWMWKIRGSSPARPLSQEAASGAPQQRARPSAPLVQVQERRMAPVEPEISPASTRPAIAVPAKAAVSPSAIRIPARSSAPAPIKQAVPRPHPETEEELHDPRKHLSIF